MRNRKSVTPEEKQKIISLYNALPPGTHNSYGVIAEQVGRSYPTVWCIMNPKQPQETAIKYFNPKEPQF